MKCRFITLDKEDKTNYIYKDTNDVVSSTWQLENEGHKVVTVQHLTAAEWEDEHKDYDNGVSVYEN